MIKRIGVADVTTNQMRENNTMNRLNVIGGCTEAASSFSSTVTGPFSILVSSLSPMVMCVSVTDKNVRPQNTFISKAILSIISESKLVRVCVCAVSLEGWDSLPYIMGPSPEITHFGDARYLFGLLPFLFRCGRSELPLLGNNGSVKTPTRAGDW